MAIMALVDDAAVPPAFVVQQGFVGAPTGHDAWGGFVEESARCRAAPRGVVEIDQTRVSRSGGHGRVCASGRRPVSHGWGSPGPLRSAPVGEAASAGSSVAWRRPVSCPPPRRRWGRRARGGRRVWSATKSPRGRAGGGEPLGARTATTTTVPPPPTVVRRTRYSGERRELAPRPPSASAGLWDSL